MTLDTPRQGVGSWWDSLADGWSRVRRSAATALTRFRPGERTSLPATADIDDATYLAGASWSLLGGDIFEDEQRVVQCAYGSFRRAIPLPAAVRGEAARASYRNGVLRIELPKQQTQRPTRRVIAVH
jgi:HSP20 family protein